MASDAPHDATQLPLARGAGLLSFERRLRLGLLLGAVAIVLPTGRLAYLHYGSKPIALAVAAALSALLAVLITLLLGQLVRPLQTLSNVVAALRENDYSFRARGARRGDVVGDLALEINALAGALQVQRSAAQDALTLLERVLTSMQSPVLAFDPEGRLRLLNTAAREAFALGPADPIGRTAHELGIDALLEVADEGLYPEALPGAVAAQPTRWSIRRTTFRLHGVPHDLLVLSDVAAVLREEERSAWQRLIRVLSHEINNSLTPIQSIAGSLRTRVDATLEADAAEDFDRGLSIIEERSASLNRFLQAYQRLSHLPPPKLKRTPLLDLATRAARLETRLAVTIAPGPAVELQCDADQMQQALINLIQNAADAALSPEASAPGRTPAVTLSWELHGAELSLRIEDNGLGIENPSNLFVPFYTTKPKGTGIGLVLVQQIATAHHGSVRLMSRRDGRGALAEMLMPVA
ncbi:PAS fold-containing protein [Granulicella rosea]|uniref:histidine kinase n=1 Tax=Granulicella rosea TaxID=474952 RepID=A0A239DUQ4_9BACT|nr:ATP-binding protein [Granulicella rosea]SNS36210.1 PAS fold-containing protein [Granulicella rosea]